VIFDLHIWLGAYNEISKGMAAGNVARQQLRTAEDVKVFVERFDVTVVLTLSRISTAISFSPRPSRSPN